MGKKKREEVCETVNEEINEFEAQPNPVLSKRPKRETAKNVSATVRKVAARPKQGNKKKAQEESVPEPPVKRNEVTKPSKTFSDYSSSDSDSAKNSKTGKKSASNSDSDSDSSSDSDSPSEKSAGGGEKQPEAKNSVTNQSPVKSYQPPPKSSSSDSYHSDTEEEDKKRRKKQKKLMKIQLNKKQRRSSSVRRDFKEEMFELDIKEEILEDDGNDNLVSNNDVPPAAMSSPSPRNQPPTGGSVPHPGRRPLPDMPDWPEGDFNELLRRMETQIPQKDNQKFDSRAAKMDWTKIAFGDYSPGDCYDVWLRISKRIRRFRTLGEILSDARDWVTKPWTNFYRGPKKNRHPDMPSRPLSTYMIYYLEHKDKVASDNPGMEMTHVSKIISELYKNLSAEERDRYSELAAKERQSFEEKLSEFYRDHPEMVPQPNKPSARDMGSKGPRKPSPPFKLFFQEQLKMVATDPMCDKKMLEDTAKEKWRQLNDKKKLIWINWALEDSKRYEDELKVYQLEHPDFVPPGVVKSVLNKDERTIKERLAGKPVKPPNSAYSLFSRVMLQSDEEVKSIPPKLRMAEISRKWKELSDGQKTRYEEKVRELQDQYKLEFASYLEGLPQEQREEELQKNQPKRKAAKAEKVEKVVVRSGRKKKAGRGATTGGKVTRSSTTSLSLYQGEPEPPPVRVFDLFLKSFLTERPAGTSEATRLKEAPKYWEILPEAKKEGYRKKLHDLKQKYIHDYEVFLKGLSPEQLKEFSLLKAKAKKMEEALEQMNRINGTLSDSNEDSESDKNDSSSDSDSAESDSGKSSKSTSSSEESAP